MGIKHKKVMTTKSKISKNKSYKIIVDLMTKSKFDMDKELNLSVLRDLCVVGVNNTMVIQGIKSTVDSSTYEKVMDFYNDFSTSSWGFNYNQKGVSDGIFFELCDDENLWAFSKTIIEMCVEDLSIKNKKVKETFINQSVEATLKTYFDNSIDEVEMIYQYGEEYFGRYREELPTTKTKLVSG